MPIEQHITPAEQIKIFVLEDNETFLKTIGYLLERHGLNNFKLFSNKDDMLKELDDNVLVFVIDYSLQNGVTGVEVIKKVKETNKHAFFIMLSGHRDFDISQEFHRAALSGQYIVKGEPGADDMLIYYIKEFIQAVTYFSTLSKFTTILNEEMGKIKEVYQKKINHHGHGMA